MNTRETHLNVKGMKCDGCIAWAREALSKVAGVVHANFDLKAGTAVVKGDADPQAVAQALTDAGYPAELRSG
jgi:copper chaperone CopZ